MSEYLSKDPAKKTISEYNKENLNEKDIEKLLKNGTLEKNLYQMFAEVADANLKYMKEVMYENVMFFRAEEQEFLARHEQKWYRAFVSSESLYMIILDFSERYNKHVENLDADITSGKTSLFTAILHLHGRALQIFLEIISLMRNGFADGAYSRWRSMYEITIIASFINKYGENVAESFIKSSDTNDRYDWAKSSGIFNKSKKYISFNDIQKNSDFDTKNWKEEYLLSNQLIHASAQGTFSRLGNGLEMHNIIPAGRSDYGMTIPAEHSAISLSQITAIFFNIFPHEDSIVYLNCINKWVDFIVESYFKTHDEVFPEAETLWKSNLNE